MNALCVGRERAEVDTSLRIALKDDGLRSQPCVKSGSFGSFCRRGCRFFLPTKFVLSKVFFQFLSHRI
jgi:hypothetical protein